MLQRDDASRSNVTLLWKLLDRTFFMCDTALIPGCFKIAFFILSCESVLTTQQCKVIDDKGMNCQLDPYIWYTQWHSMIIYLPFVGIFASIDTRYHGGGGGLPQTPVYATSSKHCVGSLLNGDGGATVFLQSIFELSFFKVYLNCNSPKYFWAVFLNCDHRPQFTPPPLQ